VDQQATVEGSFGEDWYRDTCLWKDATWHCNPKRKTLRLRSAVPRDHHRQKESQTRKKDQGRKKEVGSTGCHHKHGNPEAELVCLKGTLRNRLWGVPIIESGM